MACCEKIARKLFHPSLSGTFPLLPQEALEELLQLGRLAMASGKENVRS